MSTPIWRCDGSEAGCSNLPISRAFHVLSRAHPRPASRFRSFFRRTPRAAAGTRDWRLPFGHRAVRTPSGGCHSAIERFGRRAAAAIRPSNGSDAERRLPIAHRAVRTPSGGCPSGSQRPGRRRDLLLSCSKRSERRARRPKALFSPAGRRVGSCRAPSEGVSQRLHQSYWVDFSRVFSVVARGSPSK